MFGPCRHLGAHGGQRHATRHDHAGQVPQPRHSHHHRGEPFVARRHAEHAGPPGERPREPAKQDRGVVAVGEAVKHAGGPLRATVARIGTETGERDRPKPAQLPRGGLHLEADFPMAGVIAECDGLPVRRPQAALGAKDEELLAPELSGLPAHAGILRHAEQVAARAVAKLVLGDGEFARRPARPALKLVDLCLVRG